MSSTASNHFSSPMSIMKFEDSMYELYFYTEEVMYCQIYLEGFVDFIASISQEMQHGGWILHFWNGFLLVCISWACVPPKECFF